MNWQAIQGLLQSQVLPSSARIVLILAIAWLGYRLLLIAGQRIEEMVEDEDTTTVSEQEQRAQTLSQILRSAGLVLIVLIAGTMILRELGLDVGPIIAGAGIVGLAIGFGAQTLVKDVISGFFILLENQFSVGDSIQVDGIAGGVEKMTLRATFLRDLEGTLHIIPNGEMRTLANKTKDWARAVVNVGVGYEANLDQVLAVLEDVGRQLSADETFGPRLLEEPTAAGPLEFGDSAVTVRLMVKTRAGQQWGVGREMRRRIKEAFEQEGIEIPYPQYEVRVRSSLACKSGD
ncbi:MAG: mechanosensitive ion channel family protein [Anaerolineae bacterium]